MARNISLSRRPLLAAIGTAPLLRSNIPQEKAEDDNLSFYVAGARYNKTQNSLHAGQTVALMPNLFRGELCIEIYAGSPPERLGFAPLALLPELRRLGVVSGTLKAVTMDGVPWKRFIVEVARP